MNGTTSHAPLALASLLLLHAAQGCGGAVDVSSDPTPEATTAPSPVFSTSVARLKVGPVNWGWAGESNSCLVGKVLLTEYDRRSRTVVWPGCSCKDAGALRCDPADEFPRVERTLTQTEADTVEAAFGAVTLAPSAPCAPDGGDWLLSTFDSGGRESKYTERNINCPNFPTAKNIGGIYSALYDLKPKS
jgi:hypothetical protein